MEINFLSANLRENNMFLIWMAIDSKVRNILSVKIKIIFCQEKKCNPKKQKIKIINIILYTILAEYEKA